MKVCPAECFWYDMALAQLEDVPLRTQAPILSRMGDMVIRMCMSCNAPCEVWENRDGAPAYENNDEEGLRRVCALPAEQQVL